MFRLCLVLFLTLFSFKLWAVKGSQKIHSTAMEQVSCHLKSLYNDLDGKRGTCSGVMVSEKYLLTAKHCLFHTPSSLPSYGSMILHPAHPSDIIEPKNVDITCGGSPVTPAAFVLADRVDLALVELADEAANWIELLPYDGHENLKSHSYQCAAFGYGFNDNGQVGTFEGVLIDEFKVYSLEESITEVAVDSDFKSMAAYFANSILDTIHLDYSHFPRIMTAASKVNYPIGELKTSFEGFLKSLEEHNMGVKSLFKSETGPKYKELFFSSFKDVYAKILKSEISMRQTNLQSLGLPTDRYILNTKNTQSRERAGLDYGDSGGPFACLISGEWYLAGINARILIDSNQNWIPRPWEPMNFVPRERVTKNGEVTPLVRTLDSFLSIGLN